jgi:SET domain-containing protein
MTTDKDFIVKKSRNGKGVFANKNFNKGEVIFEFHGNFYTAQQIPTPYNKIEDHYVQIDKNLYLGPSNDLDDLFNHSCNPNAGLKINNKKIFLVAIKKIKKGDEITWDYSTSMDEDDWELNCNCGSKNCRGRIRDFKYLPANIQKKYLALGIVPKYISKHFQK